MMSVTQPEPHIVLLDHQSAGEVIALAENPRTSRHALGFTGYPVFSIELPPSPDDAIELHFEEGGRRLARGLSPTSEDEVKMAQEASGAVGADALPGILRHLPAGRYAVIRSSQAPESADEVQMGNDWVFPPAHVRVLISDRSWVALTFGAREDEAWAVDQPLIGIPILNYNTSPEQIGIWFLPLAEAAAPNTGDLILILPFEGPLVLDLMGRFSEEKSRQARARWAGQQAMSLARRLARR